MSRYDVDILRSIEAARLKERIGPKPNANSHITIHCWDHRDAEVTFTIRRKDESEDMR